jgi:chromosome partitioning protein
MKTVLVACSKGGVGKTTVATHLAAHAALSGSRCTLADADPQGSAWRWATRRAPMDSAVLPLRGARSAAVLAAVPHDTGRLVVDAAAGAMAGQLGPWLEAADAVVVPVAPSLLDVEATVDFLDTLARHPRVGDGSLPVGVVANRLKPWTNASRTLVEQLGTWPYPLVATLRDSQAYPLMVALGRSVFDYQSAHARDHQADWDPLLRWLNK